MLSWGASICCWKRKTSLRPLLGEPSTCSKYRESAWEELTVSVMLGWPFCFWAHGSTAPHGGSTLRSSPPPPSEKRGRGRARVSLFLSKTLTMAWRLPTRHRFLETVPPPFITMWGTKAFRTAPLENRSKLEQPYSWSSRRRPRLPSSSSVIVWIDFLLQYLPLPHLPLNATSNSLLNSNMKLPKHRRKDGNSLLHALSTHKDLLRSVLLSHFKDAETETYHGWMICQGEQECKFKTGQNYASSFWGLTPES